MWPLCFETLTWTVYLGLRQVMSSLTLSHRNLVLSISMRTNSGLRGQFMALICVLWRPMKSATPSAWVTHSTGVPWWLLSMQATVSTLVCTGMISEASRRYMVSPSQRPPGLDQSWQWGFHCDWNWHWYLFCVLYWPADKRDSGKLLMKLSCTEKRW